MRKTLFTTCLIMLWGGIFSGVAVRAEELLKQPLSTIELDMAGVPSFERISPTFMEKSYQVVPPYDFTFNIGYGHILSSTKGLDTGMKKIEDDLNSGLTWNMAFHRYYRKGLGWGFVYSGYKSSTSGPADNYEYSGLDFKVKQTYLAPMFCAKFAFGRDNRWMFKGEYGLGYGHTKEEINYKKKTVSCTANTFAMHSAVGLEYMLHRNIGIGLDMGIYASTYDSAKLSDGTKVDLDDDVNNSYMSISLGLRFYIF